MLFIRVIFYIGISTHEIGWLDDTGLNIWNREWKVGEICSGLIPVTLAYWEMGIARLYAVKNMFRKSFQLPIPWVSQ